MSKSISIAKSWVLISVLIRDKYIATVYKFIILRIILKNHEFKEGNSMQQNI